MACLLALAALPALDGCAHRPPERHPAALRPPPRVLVDTMRTAPPPPRPTVSPEAALRRAAARDTSYVAAVLRRCGGRTLLPDQEATREALLSMLADARAALARGDLERGRSAARDARQLATSLRCR